MNEQFGGSARPTGGAHNVRTRDLGDLRHYRGERRPGVIWRVKNLLELRRGAPAIAAAHVMGQLFSATSVRAKLYGKVYRPDFSRLAPEQILRLRVLLQAKVDLAAVQIAALRAELGGFVDASQLARHFGGELTEFGLLSTRLVTDNGVAYIVDAFQNLVELENMKFHGFGTGTTNEAQADSALVTELTTQYATDSTRPTGTTTEGASGNIYRTVATLSPDSGGTIAITEHGVFSASSAGTLLDRSKFAAINLVAGSDSLQTTYELTVSAGG